MLCSERVQNQWQENKLEKLTYIYICVCVCVYIYIEGGALSGPFH